MLINQNYRSPYICRRTIIGWRMVQSDLNPAIRGQCIAATDSMNVWLGTSHPEEIYYSSNGGINWTLQLHIADTGYVEEIMFSKQDPQIGYAFGDMAINGMWNGVRILKTTNRGLNWQIWEFENYGFSCADRSMTVIDSNRAWFGVLNLLGGLAKIINTTNGGLNWIVRDVNVGYGGPFSIQFSQDNNIGVFFGQENANSWIYRTTNSGINWSIAYSTTYYYSKSMRWIQGTSNIYGCSEFVLIRSTDDGLTWRTMTGGPGIDLESLDAVRLNNETIYSLAVTRDRRVYKLLDTVRVIGIENIGTSIPGEFRLHQNYPNPFNPYTTIEFDIPKNSNVVLKVYDVLGRAVAVLSENEFKNAGSYKVKWNASSFSSGVYFCRIQAGNFVDIKKMILVK
ncbi:MAG: T9SS type A sorting domain-containing protein [Ignavibacteria bacterium]|nr:T9SS type A sorting domain-containing protein [Ignavibacteria bacterium]